MSTLVTENMTQTRIVFGIYCHTENGSKNRIYNPGGFDFIFEKHLKVQRTKEAKVAIFSLKRLYNE